MPHRHDIRRLAMQILYQLDLRGEEDQEAIRESLQDGPDAAAIVQPAIELALDAWQHRAECDVLATELAPDWPAHRQPPVDRAILRLAHHEIISERTPHKVAINEAIILAKQFCGEQSPAFINGVLDKMAKRRPSAGVAALSQDVPAATPTDAWLNDALEK